MNNMNLSELLKLCGVGLTATFTVVLLREIRREYTPMVTLGAAVVFLLWVIPGLSGTVGFLWELEEKMESGYVGTVIRGVGVTFLTGTACEISRSAGENTIAGYIELAGRAELMLMCLPLFRELIDMAMLS